MASKVWLITGSSRGLGRAVAEVALESGHQVVATARNIIQLQDLKKTYGDQVITIALDVTNEIAAYNAVQSVIDHFGHLDILVNNAGYGNINSIEETSLTDFRAEIETNLFGTIILTKAALPFMRKRRSGHIIQVSSIGGRIGPIGRGPYAAAKWGVEGFSEVLDKEIGPLGIKVTIIEPGGFRTDFAGSSSSIHDGILDYDATVGATARFQRDYNGKQPGDPKKAAQAILKIAEMSSPPLRLLLGSDAYNGALRNDQLKTQSDKEWGDLSKSTDY
jgi:NAD(P)-dependent dehydrogenase (short-subunit alcohol dehydrogenase family)